MGWKLLAGPFRKRNTPTRELAISERQLSRKAVRFSVKKQDLLPERTVNEAHVRSAHCAALATRESVRLLSLGDEIMNIRQVEPRPEALRGLPPGDRLFHFFAQSSDGKTEYFVAVHQASDGSIRTACQCMNAIVSFVRSLNKPCCKHAAEAMKIAAWELRPRS